VPIRQEQSPQQAQKTNQFFSINSPYIKKLNTQSTDRMNAISGSAKSSGSFEISLIRLVPRHDASPATWSFAVIAYRIERLITARRTSPTAVIKCLSSTCDKLRAAAGQPIRIVFVPVGGSMKMESPQPVRKHYLRHGACLPRIGAEFPYFPEACRQRIHGPAAIYVHTLFFSAI
jgi:hypothetical protein